MWSIKTLLGVLILLAVGFSGCEKDDNDPTNPIPFIEFMSVSPTTVQEYTDSLVFTISYEDGDGDLGENNADAKNLFVTDTRNQVSYGFRIQQLAPTGANIPIQGNLKVTLDRVAILNGSATELVTFELYVVDRAGNKSNTVVSTQVEVVQ